MQKVFLILFVGVLGAYIGLQVQRVPTVMNDVLLKNVEALADSEWIEGKGWRRWDYLSYW